MMWNLFAPAEDWRHPLPVRQEDLKLLELVAERLGLRFRRDDAQLKVYLGNPKSSPSEGMGWHHRTVQLSEAEAAPYRTTGIYRAAPLLDLDRKEKLSAHFRAGEFFPNDPSYRYLRISPALISALEEIRSQLGGVPITVHSAYRPPAYNASIGGVSNSTHIDGLAADISSPGASTEQLYRVTERVIGDRGGVGYYPEQHFVHLDVRGSYSRWTG